MPSNPQPTCRGLGADAKDRHIGIVLGSADEHAAVTARIRETLPPLFELVTPMPYVELQQLLDEANAWGMFGYEKSCYVEGLPDDAIAVITDQLPHKSSPLSNLLFYRLDGAYSEVADDETSFSGGRSPRYAIFIVALAATRELLRQIAGGCDPSGRRCALTP
jgi:hypothetical protein